MMEDKTNYTFVVSLKDITTLINVNQELKLHTNRFKQDFFAAKKKLLAGKSYVYEIRLQCNWPEGENYNQM